MKKIQDLKIIEKLNFLLNLEDWKPETFAMSETVIPTIDIHATKQKLKMVKMTSDTIFSIGYKPLSQVPEGKRWTIMGFNIILDSGVSTMSYWGVTDVDVADMLLLEEITPAGELLKGILPAPLILEQYQRLLLYIDSWTSNSIWTATCWILEEDIEPQKQ